MENDRRAEEGLSWMKKGSTLLDGKNHRWVFCGFVRTRTKTRGRAAMFERMGTTTFFVKGREVIPSIRAAKMSTVLRHFPCLGNP